MSLPAPLLKDLLVGWQKIADRHRWTMYVFRAGEHVQAFTNQAQGIGELIHTIVPTGIKPEADRAK